MNAPVAPKKGRFDVSFTLLLPLLLAAQPVATDSYLPALPAIAKELGSASTSLTLFVLAFGFAQLLCGPLADRFGRRPVLLAGLACYVVAAFGGAFAGSVAVLAGWRTLQGFRWRRFWCVRAPRCATCIRRTKVRTSWHVASPAWAWSGWWRRCSVPGWCRARAGAG